MFAHLRLHSEYDVRKGVARLAGGGSVIAQAAAHCQPALALTDTNVMFGTIKFYQNCRAHGVKPIIGCEVQTGERAYLLLLCTSTAGYTNLCWLLSRAYHNDGCVHPEWMTAETTNGIIALSGGRRGEVGSLLLRNQRRAAQKSAVAWAARFPNRFYLEVWRAGEDDDVLTSETAELGRLCELPIVATHPVQCAQAEDVEILETRLCIADNSRLSSPVRQQPLAATAPYLLSTQEMQTKFADMPGALENTLEIAKRCNFMFAFGETHLPSLGGDGEDSVALLRRLAAEGLAKKMPTASSVYQERLAYETEIIVSMGFADYFLIVTDFIRWAKSQDIPVGPGRGSGAGSLVAYALDITTLDPIKYGLLFERFLNPSRVSMPDFDIDFCVDGRDRVIDYVAEKYGDSQVSQIVTFGTIGARGAIRDVGRVLGLPYGYCDRVARMVPDDLNVTLVDALEQKAEELIAEKNTDDGGRLINLALKVEGLPRNIGTHAGGVLIAPRPLEEFCPRYVAADTNTLVSQFDMVDIEKVGLVKFDFLGLRTLTILNNTVKHLRDTGRVAADFSLETIPMDDEPTYNLYAAADMIGVFQCESAGMRELMRRFRPDRFADIVALMALFRPGPLSSGDADLYIQHKQAGNRDWEESVHPLIRETLAETYGVFVYQEQVMEVARLLSGYSLGEADLLRRAMGKKKEEEMAEQRLRFITGAKQQNDVDEREAAALFDRISGFAGYGFNKSHAAAYALLSYRTAYLKTHYPAAFLAAVVSAEAGNAKKVRQILEHARQRQIAILPPDINQSNDNFYANDDKTIRYGLRALKGLGDGAINDIINARTERPFMDIFDFCTRLSESNIGAGAIESLIYAGAFDTVAGGGAEKRATLCAVLPGALATGNMSGDGLFAAETIMPAILAWPEKTKLSYERRVLGLCLSGSFYRLNQSALSALPLTAFADSTAEVGEILIAGVLVDLIKPRQLRGANYGIAVISDDETEMEIRIAADLLKQLPEHTVGEDVLVIEAAVFESNSGKRRGGSRREKTIRAINVFLLDQYFRTQMRGLQVSISDVLSPASLREVLSPAGNCRVNLHYDGETLICDNELLEGCVPTQAVYDRLKSLPGVMQVSAMFANDAR